MSRYDVKFADIPKVSLAKARAKGLKYYWTDEPCKHGHRSFRRVNGHQCLQCALRFRNEHKHKTLQAYEKKIGVQINGEVRRAIENKLFDLQLAREEAWYYV